MYFNTLKFESESEILYLMKKSAWIPIFFMIIAGVGFTLFKINRIPGIYGHITVKTHPAQRDLYAIDSSGISYKTTSAKNGYYELKLPPGNYQYLVKDGDKLICFDNSHNLCKFTVAVSGKKQININFYEF